MPLMPHIHPSCIIPHAQDKSIDAPAVPHSSTGMPEIGLFVVVGIVRVVVDVVGIVVIVISLIPIIIVPIVAIVVIGIVIIRIRLQINLRAQHIVSRLVHQLRIKDQHQLLGVVVAPMLRVAQQSPQGYGIQRHVDQQSVVEAHRAVAVNLGP